MLKRENLTVVLTFDLCCVTLYISDTTILLKCCCCCMWHLVEIDSHCESQCVITDSNYTQGAIVYKKVVQCFFFRNNEIFISFLRPYCPVLVLISTYIQLLQPWVDYSSGCSPWCFRLYGKCYPVSRDTRKCLCEWMNERFECSGRVKKHYFVEPVKPL